MVENIILIGAIAALTALYPGTEYVPVTSTQDSWVVGSNSICLHLDGDYPDYMLKNYKSKDVSYAMINTNTMALEHVGYCDDYVSLCEQICPEYGICPELIEALIETESSGYQSAKNGNCYGICQINADVWGDEYQTLESQITFACELLLSYDCEDISDALSHYNGQTYVHYDGYAETVLNRAADLEREHGK